MAVTGSPDPWMAVFPGRLIPKILDLVLATWAALPKPAPCELEPRITRRLRNALRQAKNMARDLPCLIDREVTEDAPGSAMEKGRIDIRFIHGYDEAVYFAFECKRLNVPTSRPSCRSLASEYADEGMLRFVTGQYAANLERGGMIGFVMNGNVPAAISSVDSAVQARVGALKMALGKGLSSSTVLPENSAVRETQHLCHTPALTLHHLFLAV